MPKYAYHCDKCSVTYEVVHSIKETIDTCKHCGASEDFNRVPSLFNKMSDIKKKEHQTGTVVKETIEDMRIDIKEYQSNLKKRKYES